MVETVIPLMQSKFSQVLLVFNPIMCAPIPCNLSLDCIMNNPKPCVNLKMNNFQELNKVQLNINFINYNLVFTLFFGPDNASS
jgi:hypothetical protein